MDIEFHRHSITDKDIQAVTKVLRSIILTTGSINNDFEIKFSNYTGLREQVCLNSCTAALHLSLLALGVGPGDEVITTPLTFIASATSILHTGATPVFVDVERATGLIDMQKVESAITEKTRVIMPVHLYGVMADMITLREIADRHNLKIVEDSAHCIEGERDGVRPGQLSDASCYSFYATKNMTCGEGGALGTNNDDLASKIKILRTHGMSKDAATRYYKKYEHWDMIMYGWKYNLDDIHAALLVNQLERLDRYWKRREEISTMYDSELSDLEGLELPATKGKSARHLYTIWVDPERRDDILRKLQEKGIGVAVNYRAIHNLTFFRERYSFTPNSFPVANKIGNRTISIPLYPSLTNPEIEYIVDCLKEIIN
jgi:dTDP-4-amino-4,6-dideoxygalactose transaminase